MKTLYSTHLLILYKNKYLLQLRDNKKGIHFPGFWGLFGGRIKPNETSLKAIKREIIEETNLVINKFNYKYRFNIQGKDLVRTRDITYYQGELKNLPNKILIREGKDFGFFSFNEIKKIKITSFDFAAISFHYFTKILKKDVLPKKFKY